MEYSQLVTLYEKITGTSKRLEKTSYIAETLKKASVDELRMLFLLLRGKVFSDYENKKLGFSTSLILKALAVSTGRDSKKIESEWKKTGDLGKVASNLIQSKHQSTLFQTHLTVKKVFNNIRKLAEIEGSGSVDTKVQLVSELLTSANQAEAKYIVRTVLEEMRVGIGEGSVRDAILWAYFGDELEVKYDKEKNDITLDDKKREKYNEYLAILQNAYDSINDFAQVAKVAKEKGIEGLKTIGISPGLPIKVMLAQKVKGINEGFERVGKPADLEYKYDGFRMQIHKTKDTITIYTRNLENVTKQFPEVIKTLKEHVKGEDYILDGEAVGFNPKTNQYVPFQNISQRIKRKYDIDKISEELRVELNLFDVVYYNGESLISKTFAQRKKFLKTLIKEVPKSIIIAKSIETDSAEVAEKFYQEALKMGQEGIMMKKLDSIYKPGSRVEGWVKVKPVMESLDLVIVGAEWGEGKRSGWFTSFILACLDEDSGELVEIGRVGTGIKELEEEGLTFEQLTKLLKPLVISEKGKIATIKPQVVIEINYEEIQKSPSYSSGYALRFPRVVRLREDRSPEEASTLNQVREFYEGQF